MARVGLSGRGFTGGLNGWEVLDEKALIAEKEGSRPLASFLH